MKKLFISLGLGALLLGGTTFGQNARKVMVPKSGIQTVNVKELRSRYLEENSAPIYSAPANNTGVGIISSDRTTAFTAQTIGTSANVYSIIRGVENQTFAVPDLNVVGFTHRNNSTNFSGSGAWANGLTRFDLSTDGGNTFSNDLGPLMVDEGTGNLGSIRPRFPQGVLVPMGTAVADLRLVATSTAWVNNTAGGGADWGWGLRMLAWDIANFTAAQVNDPFSNTTKWFEVPQNRYDGLIESGLCYNKDANGTYRAWLVNNYYNTAEKFLDTLYIFKGEFTNNAQAMNWTMQKVKVGTSYDPTDSSARMSSPVMEFSPNGQYGWIGFGANLDHDNNPYNIESFWGQNVVFYKSSDYGQTWTGPIEVDLTQFPDLIEALKVVFVDSLGNPTDSTSQVPMVLSDVDITVDVNGNPHFFCSVYNHSFRNTPAPDSLGFLNVAPKVLVDVTTPDQGQTWDVRIIDTLYFSQWFQDINDQQSLREFSWVQVGRSQNGRVIGYVYINDTSANFTNTGISNVWSAGFRVTDSAVATPMGHSNGSSFNGIVFWPQLSPIFLENPGQEFVLPIAFTTETAGIPSSGVVQWYYTGSVKLDTTRFGASDTSTVNIRPQVKANVPVIAYPNPVKDVVSITTQITGNAIIEVNDIQGRKLVLKVVSGKGRINETLDLSKLPQGIYFIKVTTSNGTGVVKIVKE